MRLLRPKTSPTAGGAAAPAAAAAGLRLRVIAGRGKAEQSCYPQLPDAPEPAKTPIAARLFWTPGELAALAGSTP